MHSTTVFIASLLPLLVASVGTRGNIITTTPTVLGTNTGYYWNIGPQNSGHNADVWVYNIPFGGIGPGAAFYVDWNVGCVVEYWCGTSATDLQKTKWYVPEIPTTGETAHLMVCGGQSEFPTMVNATCP